MSKFTRPKAGKNATNIGASFDISSYTSELPKGFYDDGKRLPSYSDSQRCVFSRTMTSTKTKRFEQRCGQPRLVGELCFSHCTLEQRLQYQKERDAKKKYPR